MKYVAWVFAGVTALLAALVVAQHLAAERVEVIEVHGLDPDGSIVTTRLWVVDHEGDMYVRVGADGSGWYTRMQANPQFEMTRGDKTTLVTAVSRPDKRELINALMQDKYTWGDTLISGLVGGREGATPILLKPN